MFRLTSLARRITTANSLRLIPTTTITSSSSSSSFHTTAAAMALTQSQIAIVKSTAPILKQHGETITRVFYANMLTAHPELQAMFSLRNQATGAQQTALAGAVLAYATYIDDLPKLTSAVERIAHKHASLFVKPEQYAVVGEHLVGAFAQVLGDGLTDEVADAWTAAYGQLAEVFIGRERQLYEDAGSWQDWRDFVIAKKEDVSHGVVSFYLEPKDKQPLPSFLPGQYVSVQIPIKELGGLLQSRQYSLSAAPGSPSTYRITVKREPTTTGVPADDLKSLAAGAVTGIVGNRLHADYQVGDTVQLSPPRGEFVFDATKMSAAAPVVLLSAGVGATPMLSILDSIRDNASSASGSGGRPREVTWAHGARSSDAVCYGRHVRQAAADADANLTAKVFLGSVAEGDIKGVDYDYTGHFDLGKLVADKVLPLERADAEYFICGPKDWMILVRDGLQANGVDTEKIHLELFATGGV